MWPDLLVRVLPELLIPLLYIFLLRLPLSFLGLTWNNVPQQVSVGLFIGAAMIAFSILYRTYVVGTNFRRPTLPDHAFQTFYYLFINAPAEELFFRGFLLAAITQWTGWIGWGWLLSTASYIFYHRLGKWSWRSIGGVAIAGLLFSLLYVAQPTPRSLISIIIIHGLTTAGFLNLSDETLYHRWKRRHQPPPSPTR